MQVQWPADRCHPAMPALVSSAPATGHPTHPAALWFTSLVCAMTVLDANVVGIVLPALSRALARSATELEWMVSAYALCFAALLLPAGRLADRLGRRRVLLAGLAGFGAAFQLQYRGYRKTLGRAGGFTAPSFSWQPDSGAGSRPKP